VTAAPAASVVDAFRAAASHAGDRAMVVTAQASTSGRELVELVDAKVDALSRLGVGEGARVGVVAWPPEAFVSDLFALFALGALALPLSAETTAWELARVDLQAGLTHLLAPGSSELSLGPSTTTIGRQLGSCAQHTASAVPAGAAILQLTSGTTGRHGLAVRPASALLSEAAHYRQGLSLTSDDRIFSSLPLHHAYGLGLCCLAAPLVPAAVEYASHVARRPRMLLRALADSHATIFPTVPAMLRVVARAGGEATLPSLRAVITAGAPLDRHTGQEGRKLGQAVGQVYGTTETGPICIQPPDADRMSWQAVGPPLDDVEVRLAASAYQGGAPAPVHVRSPSMLLGYWEDGGLDDTCIAAGAFATGDLGYFDGSELVLTGRISNALKVAGETISPEEIEAALLGCPDVDAALVSGLPDDRLGQRIHARVAPKTVSLEVLRRLCEQRLAPSKVPHVFDAVASLPRTASGKIIRTATARAT